eukprot:TRINITY_DN2938_c0_g1_i1.p1 TRINITY_DN2938_c0_g1~~TRINITY_DN2938_c0_g1_i1.p1  ORF type:complete len:574 (-),score=111.19 TRINITY_DN2938_c0_g1_i1:30-1751(-)
MNTQTNKILLCIILSILISLVSSSETESLSSFVGRKFLRLDESYANSPGIHCVACTAVLSIVEQMTEVHETSVAHTMEKLCDYLPTEFSTYCVSLIETYGATVIAMLNQGENPDKVCHQIQFCTDPQCFLYTDDGSAGKGFVKSDKYPEPALEKLGKSPIDWIIEQMYKVFQNHLPLVDFDSDKFGISKEFRGSSWRGLDCDDLDSNVYPGRKINSQSDDRDHNCNGIHGTNPDTGKSYEEELCNVTQYGVGILGDSAAAHFHIPGEWFEAKKINQTTYKDIIKILTNEMDWPMMSSVTGYEENTWSGHPVGKVSSTYLKILERNKCSHRDYQNIAVNGARSGAMSRDIVQSLARNQKFDNPMFLTLALIGNDVCNGHHTIDTMTTPAQMYENTMRTLNYLDTVLPPKSFLFLGGLANGTLLYEIMHNRIHPLGMLHNDITYASFYHFLNCNNISPCFGWMNTNATWRERTQQRADELNLALQKLANTEKFNNFEVIYFDQQFNKLIDQWVQSGGNAWDLIEVVDGFHPSQIANYLSAEFHWKEISEKYPHTLPPINPNNEKITKLFGSQNGY